MFAPEVQSTGLESKPFAVLPSTFFAFHCLFLLHSPWPWMGALGAVLALALVNLGEQSI